MRTSLVSPLHQLLFPSSVRRAVLERLLLTEADWHPRELARELEMSVSAVATELSKLAQAGVAQCRKVGNQLRYAANRDCPVYAELRGLLTRTSSAVDVIGQALAAVESGIELAYIFGSMADGTLRQGSDIDLMVVGAVDPEAVDQAVFSAEEVLRREVNPLVYSSAQYWREQGRAGSFIQRLHAGPTILLRGTMHGPE